MVSPSTPFPFEDEKIDLRSGLTDAELKCMNSLVEAWNLFTMLPDHRSDDIDEFRRGIHQLQNLFALRTVRRNNPEYWT